MKTIQTMLIDTKKKAFTLIELLIVVAIIGILAGVGVPMYSGYMASAKLESAKTNHKSINTFVSANLTQCATGLQEVCLEREELDVQVAPVNSPENLELILML